MTLQELLSSIASGSITVSQPRTATSVPDWMLGCFRRHCISFANGESDSTTLVFWFQSRNFTIDLRLPRPSERLPAKPLQNCTARELQVLANYEGWAAKSSWDGTCMAWQEGASLQIHNRWPEPAELRRIGNCMIEFAPSGAYVEDWRLQPSAPGPLIGLQLVEERNQTTAEVLHRGGGLIICGDFAALVRGRPQPLKITAETLPEAVSQTTDPEELAHLLNFDTSVARGSLAAGYTVQHSTHAQRIGQPLLPLHEGDWVLEDGQLLHITEENGQHIERRFEIDTLCAQQDFIQTTPWTAQAQTWFAREATTLARYTSELTNVDRFKPLNLAGFNAPTQWQGRATVLIAADPALADQDLEAVRSSQADLKHLFGPEDDWPPQALTLEEDRADLAWHAQEFAAGRSFAYHLFDTSRTRCLGCLYLYPTASLAHDAEAYLWTRSDLDRAKAASIEEEVLVWVADQWPFAALVWPGRSLPFSAWQEYQAPSYYASTRFIEPFTPGSNIAGTVN
ncbi:MAG: hypothetical protein JKY58_14170 [Pseudomonas sp.]|nr:hypothetical protein [Pseudomonas sp.]